MSRQFYTSEPMDPGTAHASYDPIAESVQSVTSSEQDFKKESHGSGGGGIYIIALIIAAPMVLLESGLNKAKAVEVYQQRYASHFKCPYNRSGSCSETLRNDGVKALACKCRNARRGVV